MSTHDLFMNKMNDKISQRKTAFVLRIFIVAIIVLLVLVYFILPFSRINNYTLEGTYFYTKEEILNICELSKSTYLFNINKEKVLASLNNYPLFNDESSVTITPFSYKVKVKEIAPILNINNQIYLNDQTYLSDELKNNLLVKDKIAFEIDKIPTLINEESKFTALKAEYTSLNNCLNEFVLSLCGYQSMNIAYLKLEEITSEPNVNIKLYFAINDSIKEKYFANQQGYYVFYLDASTINYSLKKINLKKFSASILKVYNDFLSDSVVNKSNIESASLTNEIIDNQEVATRTFKINISIEKSTVEILAIK